MKVVPEENFKRLMRWLNDPVLLTLDLKHNLVMLNVIQLIFAVGHY